MNLYISLYSVQGIEVFLTNGFSFGVEPEKDDVFLLYSKSIYPFDVLNDIQKYNPEKIFCTLTYVSDLDFFKPLLSKKWVIGGPLLSRPWVPSLLSPSGATIVFGSIESYYGKELSGKFFNYFEDTMKQRFPSPYKIYYSASLGYGCYWGKCNFCSFRDFIFWANSKDVKKPDIVERPNIENILDSLPENAIAHTCIDSLPSGILDKVLSTKKTTTLWSYLRPDKKIIETIEKYKDLSNQEITIGFEGFSQSVLDELGKGFRMEDAVRLLESIVERNGRVSVPLMMMLPFLTKESVEESFVTIDKILEILKKNLRKDRLLVTFSTGGQVWWPTKEKAEKYGFKVSGALEWYYCVIPKNSEMYNYNKQIIVYLKKNNINIETHKYKRMPGQPGL